MKAKEVLRRYAAGERDFGGLNLRGQSFKGANLSDADFTNAKLQGTKFTNATLTKANFTGAKCGLQKRWAIFLTIVSLLLAGIPGFLSSFSGIFVSFIFDSSSRENQIVVPCQA